MRIFIVNLSQKEMHMLFALLAALVLSLSAATSVNAAEPREYTGPIIDAHRLQRAA
jgi:hypothetical protein